jgi:hypothetical protein
MPFVVADTGTVGDDNTLTSEVARELADSKAPALVDWFLVRGSTRDDSITRQTTTQQDA